MTVPEAAPLEGDTCTQLQPGVLGITALKVAPLAELVRLKLCDAGVGPPAVCVKVMVLGVAVTLMFEVIVSDTGKMMGIGKPTIFPVMLGPPLMVIAPL